MDRPPHERALHDRAPLERPREVGATESFEARRKADVRVRRVLVLDAAHSLDGPCERVAGRGRAQLAREERPVQLRAREGALSHRLSIVEPWRSSFTVAGSRG